MNAVNYAALPRLRRGALTVVRRNMLVWRKLLGAAVLMHLAEPTLYLLALGYGLGTFIREMAGVPYLTFLASGILVSSAMTTASIECMYSVFARLSHQKTYDALLATPLIVDDIVAGELIWASIKALMSGLSILLVSALLGVVGGWQVLLAIPALFLTGLCFAGPALVITARARRWDFFQYYITLFLTPMMLLSGVFYPTTALPETMQTIIQVLPLTHAVALIRPLVIGEPVSAPVLNIAVLTGYAVVGWYLATVFIRRRLIV